MIRGFDVSLNGGGAAAAAATVILSRRRDVMDVSGTGGGGGPQDEEPGSGVVPFLLAIGIIVVALAAYIVFNLSAAPDPGAPALGGRHAQADIRSR